MIFHLGHPAYHYLVQVLVPVVEVLYLETGHGQFMGQILRGYLQVHVTAKPVIGN
jgi:hypothetical protein